MPDVQPERLICIVTGITPVAELGDRPLAYRIEKQIRKQILSHFGKPAKGTPPVLAPIVMSDVYYLNNEELQSRPVISVGGPGVNALSAMLVNELPTAVAIEKTLLVQMDVELTDRRCAVWGMNHLDTIRAVKLFMAKGYLERFVGGVIESLDK